MCLICSHPCPIQSVDWHSASEQHWDKLGAEGSLTPSVTCLKPGIWLGNLAVASTHCLMHNNYTAVLNCTHNHIAAGHDYSDVGIAFHRFSIPGRTQWRCQLQLKELLEFVCCQLRNRDSGHEPKLLIHCLAGRRRAGTVSALVLMHVHGLSMHEAIHHVQSLRPLSDISRDNLDWLKWAQTCM